MDYHIIKDKITGKGFPLSNVIVSAYHSPQRYYGEIQNRVNISELLKILPLLPINTTTQIAIVESYYQTLFQYHLLLQMNFGYL